MADDLILGRYRPLEVRGVGGSGTVQICWDTRIQRRVAIKRMPLAGQRGANGPTPGLAEARTGAMLSHPDIVSVIDFETTDDEALLIMEAIEGPTLAELIDETPAGEFDPDIAAYVAECVGGALDFAHENQVLHLDIKPENILVTRGGVVKVSDFGISELADAQGFGEASGGTIGYMPPEQIRGEDLDQRCDEFAFAVVVYEMLTGRSPFMAPTMEASLRLMQSAAPEPPSDLRDDLGPELDAVVLAAMSPTRDERFETVYDFLDALSGLLGDPRAGAAKLKALVRPEDEADERPRPHMQRGGLWERVPESASAALGRAASAALCWGLTAVGLIAYVPADTPTCLALALLAAAAGAAKPQLGAFVALVGIGCGSIVTEMRAQAGAPAGLAAACAPGALLVLATLAWVVLARRESSADANCALAAFPLGALGLTPFGPLIAGFVLPPRRAALASAFGGIIALVLATLSGSGSLLRFGPLLGTGAPAPTISERLLTSPSSWIIILACVISAVLMSLLCSRQTALSCTLGAFSSAAVLISAKAVAQWLQTGGWAAPDLSWTVATLLSLTGMIVISVLGTPRHDRGES